MARQPAETETRRQLRDLAIQAGNRELAAETLQIMAGSDPQSVTDEKLAAARKRWEAKVQALTRQ